MTSGRSVAQYRHSTREDTWAVDTQFEVWTRNLRDGGCVADLNGDGFPDLALTSWMEVVLLLSTGEGSWYRAGAARGVVMNEAQTIGWGVTLGDLDTTGTRTSAWRWGLWSCRPRTLPSRSRKGS